MNSRMARSSWMIARWVSSANQRSTWFSQGAAGGGEVHLVTRALGQPVPDHRAFVGGVIVDDQMNLELLRDRLVNGVKELAKFQAPMTPMTLADHLAGGHVQCGK